MDELIRLRMEEAQILETKIKAYRHHLAWAKYYVANGLIGFRGPLVEPEVGLYQVVLEGKEIDARLCERLIREDIENRDKLDAHEKKKEQRISELTFWKR